MAADCKARTSQVQRYCELYNSLAQGAAPGLPLDERQAEYLEYSDGDEGYKIAKRAPELGASSAQPA